MTYQITAKLPVSQSKHTKDETPYHKERSRKEEKENEKERIRANGFQRPLAGIQRVTIRGYKKGQRALAAESWEAE